MKFRLIVLIGGDIFRQSDLDTQWLDPAYLQTMAHHLSRLHGGASPVKLDVATALPRYLSLGYPEDIRYYETGHDRGVQGQFFHVREQDGTLNQIGLVLPPKPRGNLEEDARATHEIVSGSFDYFHIMNAMKCVMSGCTASEPMYPVADYDDLETTEAEILRSRPVFVSALLPPSTILEKEALFSLTRDYFSCAAAMLLERCQDAAEHLKGGVSL